VPAVRGLSSPFYLTHNAIEVSTLRLLTGFCPVLISFLQKFMNTSATRNVRESLEEIDIRTALNLRKFERCERYQAALAVRLDSLAINIEDFAIYIATERFFALLIPCKSANPVSKDAPPPISRIFARRVYNSIPWSSMNNGTSAVSKRAAIAVEVPSCIRYSATLRWHLRIMPTIMQTPMRAYSGISRRYDKELAIRERSVYRDIYDSIWNRFSKYSYECRTFRRKWI